MRPHPNNDLYRIPSERNKGIIGTAVIHAVALLLLIVLGFSVPPPPESEEGILVNFGTGETGFGAVEPSPPPSRTETSPPPPPPPAAVPQTVSGEQALLTQDIEEAPEVKKVDPAAEKRRLEQLEAEKKRRAEMEAERIRREIEAERIRKEREEAERIRREKEAEEKRMAEIKSRTMGALEGSKNAGTTSKSEGIAGGAGNQGSPTGSVDSRNRGEGSGLGDKGVSYDLGGRGVQRLPLPEYIYQTEGRVVVEIRVDRSGKVIAANPGAKGSTSLDENLLKLAKSAAEKAQFNPDPDAPFTQVGTITYIFKLN
ncbi:MAG TPA: energy transducer TonB [Bacteroidales bacterium]|nr:energy transducer TonB [Bacteroidales bacterium]HQH25314.1 energy transducer TonB [Bacteroidales bacterium]HQJ82464.1 energy transducer TonB [Bacteroidales bacterium]